MATYKRLPREKVKKNDQFVSTVDHGLHWVQDNRNLFIAAVVALVALFLIVFIGKTWQEKNLARTGQEVEAYSQAKDAEGLKKLAFAGSKGDWLAASALISLTKKDAVDESTFKALEVIAEKGPAPAKDLALLSAALSYMEKGDNEKAKSLLHKMELGEMKEVAWLYLGDLSASTGDFAAARRYYADVSLLEGEEEADLRRKASERLAQPGLSVIPAASDTNEKKGQ